MTATEKLTKVAKDNPDADPRLLAKRVVATLSRADIIQLVAEEIRDLQRRFVKLVENDALEALFARGDSDVQVAASGEDDPLRVLFGRKLAIGDGQKVNAEDMTLDQWVARRAMLIAIRDGTDRAIRVCDVAIRRLSASGARSLGQVGVAA